MLPRIKKAELGKIHINDDVITNDFFIHHNGLEHLEKPMLLKEDFERMMLHEPEAAIFGVGFKGRFKVPADVMDAARRSSIDIHILNTPDALEKFKELTRDGKKVVAHIHVGE